jgi:hypothetical protein
MSHFTVLVIGDDPEDALAPFCEDPDPQYRVDTDITAEAEDDFRIHKNDDGGYADFLTFCEKWYGYETCAHEEVPNVFGRHSQGYIVLNEIGSVSRVVRREAVNGKWDWYVLGGRWSGFFKLKQGADGKIGEPGLMTSPAEPGYADAAFKRDIDFAAMRMTARQEAAERYDRFHAVLANYLNTRSFNEISSLLGVDEARATYRGQPGVKALEEAGFSPFFRDVIEEYGIPREQYLERAANRAISAYAFIKDGEWVGRGEMGWFGISEDNMDEDAWLSRFNDMLDSLPEDTLLSLYDCHV